MRLSGLSSVSLNVGILLRDINPSSCWQFPLSTARAELSILPKRSQTRNLVIDRSKNC